MSVSKKILPAAIALALLVPVTGMAAGRDGSGMYVGAAANRLDASFDDASNVSFDDSDTTWSVFGGFMFNKWFGAEVGYLDLGSYASDSGLKLDADAISLAAVANWNLSNNFALYGKLGVFFLESNSEQVIPGIGLVQDGEDSTQEYVAVGAQFNFGNGLGLYGEYSWADTSVNDLNIDIISVGLKYYF